VRLRWGTFAAEIAMILSAGRILDTPLPTATLLLLASVIAVSNVALARLNSRRALDTTWIGSILAVDNLQLTALLSLSGGTANPFSVFYLVQITLAAVTLEARWTWVVTALGVFGYGALFLLPSQHGGPSAHAVRGYELHLQAMWIAFAASAALTAFFVSRLTSRLAQSQAELGAVRDIAARHERLAALTTLAAGAAHQLGTPLATIAIAAGELERTIGALDPPPAPLLDDVRLIRSEIKRSREILDGLARSAGQSSGEMPSAFSALDLVADVLAETGRVDAGRVRVLDRSGGRAAWLPRRAVARAIANLVRNALDASSATQEVSLTIDFVPDLHVEVHDEGGGMSPDVLARACEPFFTTKGPGHGLGLGLFVTRSLAEDLGGTFDLQSSAAGTTATMTLPARVNHAEPA